MKLRELKGIVQKAIDSGNGENLLKEKIKEIATEYETRLHEKIQKRVDEMQSDDNSHYLIYQILGISETEGEKIDLYQNKGRFLYKYAGAFLEDSVSLCLFFNNPNGGKSYVDNTKGSRPKKFEIDFLDNTDAIEIKWRDATTDGDHIIKEHTRAQVISKKYKPIRVMFYAPQRGQAIKIQETLKTVYTGLGGEYYSGHEAWNFIKQKTGYDLLNILTAIAEEKRANK